VDFGGAKRGPEGQKQEENPNRLATRHELEDIPSVHSSSTTQVMALYESIWTMYFIVRSSFLSRLSGSKEQVSVGRATVYVHAVFRTSLATQRMAMRLSLLPSSLLCLCLVSTPPVCTSLDLFCRGGVRPRPKVSSQRYTLWIGTISSYPVHPAHSVQTHGDGSNGRQ
jgi:hypothetical protein